LELFFSILALRPRNYGLKVGVSLQSSAAAVISFLNHQFNLIDTILL
jgi:hypothetical protein